MDNISQQDFDAIEIRAGTIERVEPFPEAHKPAYKIWVDLGDELGIKQSSAQITDLYDPEELVGTQVVCVTNIPDRQVGPFMSEVLITGFYREDGAVVLTQPESEVPNGAKLA